MRPIGRYIWAVVLLVFLLGGPVCNALAGDGAAQHHGSAAGSHHEPVDYGPLHCLFSSCVPALPAKAGAGELHDFGGMVAFASPADSKALPAASIEGDPPVPRLPA